MTWTPERHAEHKRTLAMLTRCAGNADGAKGRPGTGEARQTKVVPWRSGRFVHELAAQRPNVWPGIVGGIITPSGSAISSRCFTDAPALSCTCGAFALEWR